MVAAGFRFLGDARELPAGSLARFPIRHPGLAIRLRLHRQMKGELIVQIALYLAAEKQRAQTQAQPVKPVPGSHQASSNRIT
jgi:hypothetical protein